LSTLFETKKIKKNNLEVKSDSSARTAKMSERVQVSGTVPPRCTTPTSSRAVRPIWTSLSVSFHRASSPTSDKERDIELNREK
jgi:hypothetical protein